MRHTVGTDNKKQVDTGVDHPLPVTPYIDGLEASWDAPIPVGGPTLKQLQSIDNTLNKLQQQNDMIIFLLQGIVE